MKIYTTKISHAISDVKKEQWDAIAPDPFMTYGCLQTIEKTYIGSVRPTYHTVWDRDMLAGAAVCYIVEKDERLFTIDNYLFGRFEKYAANLGASFLPVFLCGSLSFEGGHISIDNNRDMNDRETILNLLLDAIEIEAKHHNLPICFSHITDDEYRLSRLLKNRNYNHTVIPPFYYLDIEWSSFDEYVESLKQISRSSKKRVKNEINRNKKEGVRIEIEKEPGKYQDRLYELINNNYHKHNDLQIYFSWEFVNELKRNIGNDSVFYVSWKDNMITGCSILLRKNDAGHVYLVGVDEELVKNDRTYFNLCYYRPIQDAISNGLKKMKFGMGEHKVKTRRGCKTGNSYIYYKASGKRFNFVLKPLFALFSSWYQRKNALILKKIGG